MRRIPTLVLLVVLVARAAGTQPAGARTPCPPPAESARTGARLQALLDSLARAHPGVAGISLAAIGAGNCLRFQEATGLADRATGERLTPAHTHRIASNTKTYTAAAILRLVEERRLSLDDPIARHVTRVHVDALRRGGYPVDAITLRHLLTHRAGLYDYATDDRFVARILADPTHRWTRTEQLDSAIAWGAPYGRPDDVFHYSDTGYILLGEVLERVSGQPLAAALRSLLAFPRLGLRATWLETLEPQPSTAGPRAHQYLGPTDSFDFDASFDLYGGGGLVATPMDMALFTRALLTGLVFRNPATLETMTTTIGSSTAPRSYAAGIGRVQVLQASGWGHSGFWNTFSWHFPEHDVTIAASITDQGNAAVSRALLEGVTHVLFR